MADRVTLNNGNDQRTKENGVSLWLMSYTDSTRVHEHLGPFDMQQNNGLKFSLDRKITSIFNWMFLGEGGGGISKMSNGRYARKNQFVWPLSTVNWQV